MTKYIVLLIIIITAMATYILGYYNGRDDMSHYETTFSASLRAAAIRNCSDSKDVIKCFRNDSEFFIDYALLVYAKNDETKLSALAPYIFPGFTKARKRLLLI